MSECRSHFAHSCQSGNVDQFGLQLLKPGFGLLALSEIAYETCEEALIAGSHFSDRKLHRKRRAILAFTHDHAADSDNAPFAGSQITLQIAVVVLAIGRGHQPLDVGSYNICRDVAEQSLGCGAKGLDDATLVDYDHSIGHGIENRFEMRFTGKCILGAAGRTDAAALQLLAAPGNSRPN